MILLITRTKTRNVYNKQGISVGHFVDRDISHEKDEQYYINKKSSSHLKDSNPCLHTSYRLQSSTYTAVLLRTAWKPIDF